jgi:hypothetical protein
LLFLVLLVCGRQLSTPQTAADGCFIKIWKHEPRITTRLPRPPRPPRFGECNKNKSQKKSKTPIIRNSESANPIYPELFINFKRHFKSIDAPKGVCSDGSFRRRGDATQPPGGKAHLWIEIINRNSSSSSFGEIQRRRRTEKFIDAQNNQPKVLNQIWNKFYISRALSSFGISLAMCIL